MPDAVLLAPLVVAVALVTAGLGKVRRPPGLLRDAFEGLGVPAALSGPVVVGALPWLEVVLGLALLLPGAAFAVAAVLATLLMATYAVLVLRVVLAGDEVDCDCFGGLGDGAVGPRTAVRNLLLLGAAALAVGDGFAGHSLVGRLADLDASAWAWLLAAVATAVLVAVTVVSGGGAPDDVPERRGIPYLHVQTDDGASVSLPELASLRPQLLVTLSTTCTHCARVDEVIATWPDLTPELDVRVLTATPVGEELPDSWPSGALHDPQEQVAAVLGLVRPSAVLLGADALVAGGPVHGAGAVLAFYDEVRAALEAARGQA